MMRASCREVAERHAGRAWMVAGLVVAAVLALPLRGARAEEPLVAGAKDVGFGTVFSISYNTAEDEHTVKGLDLLPHGGYVVSDARGPGWLRGNFEVLLEPTLTFLESRGKTSTVVGAAALARWVFAGLGRFRPYVEGGAGGLLGEMNLRQTDCDVNFLLEAGPGFLVFLSDQTALTVGYRFQHISNAGACRFNEGINSNALYVGVSHFFR
jgi:lipid A 3-O-deacylase